MTRLCECIFEILKKTSQNYAVEMQVVIASATTRQILKLLVLALHDNPSSCVRAEGRQRARSIKTAAPKLIRSRRRRPNRWEVSLQGVLLSFLCALDRDGHIPCPYVCTVQSRANVCTLQVGGRTCVGTRRRRRRHPNYLRRPHHKNFIVPL